MNMSEFFLVPQDQPIVTCPNCGDSHYESNRFSEALLLELEREASLLCANGMRRKAQALQRAVADVRVENEQRHELFCLSCGVTFDA